MKGDLYRQLFRASTVGLTLVVSTFVGLGIGVLLDKYLGTRPWLTIIFLLIGIGTGFRDLFKFVNRDEGPGGRDSDS